MSRCEWQTATCRQVRPDELTELTCNPVSLLATLTLDTQTHTQTHTLWIQIIDAFCTVFTQMWLRYVRLLLLSQICLSSVVCLSSATFLHPTQGDKNFDNISLPFWPLCKILQIFVHLSVCLSGTGVHCDHTVHGSTNLSLWLDSPMFWAPWHGSMSI